MAADAPVGLDDVKELALGLVGDVDAVAIRPGAREQALIGHLDHRVPVDGRIVLRRRLVIRRHNGGQVELLAGLAVDLGRVDEAIAAHPDLVFRLREVGDHVATLIVGDDHLGHSGAEVGRFGNHPHAGFRPARPGDHAAEIVGVDGDHVLGAELHRRQGQEPSNTCQRHAQ